MRGIAKKMEIAYLNEMEFIIRVGLPIDPHSEQSRLEGKAIIEQWEKLIGHWVEIKEEIKGEQKIKTENYEAIDKALKWAEKQQEKMIFSGDHEGALDAAMILLNAKVALLDEDKK